MLRPLICVGLLLVCSREPACGEGDAHGGINAPCTRPKDCEDRLVCREGVCTSTAPATPDAGTPDTGLPDARDASPE